MTWLPPRSTVIPILAGLLAFVGSFIVGLGLTLLIAYLLPNFVEQPTSAYQKFGDELIGLYAFVIGGLISLFTSIIIGCAVGERVSASYAPPQPPEPTPAPSMYFPRETPFDPRNRNG